MSPTNNILYKALVADDEPLARQGLRDILAQENRIEVIGEAANGFEAIQQIDQQKPDLVFLDIEMPGLNGFEVLQQVNHIPFVIFTTAFDKYALQAFETLAIDFLLKPIELESLQRSLSKLGTIEENMRRLRPILTPGTGEETRKKGYLRRFAIKQGNHWKSIGEDNIVLFFSEDKFCHLRSGKVDWTINHTLQNLETLLDPEKFCRIHRSTIISQAHIRKIKSLGSGRYEILLSDGTQVETSRSYGHRLKEFLHNAPAS